MADPEALYLIAHAVLEAAAAACTDADLEVPARQYVADGPIVAWDCEQLVVAVENTLGHQGEVSVEDVAAVRCVTMRAATIGIWLTLCCPALDDDGNPPTVAEIDASAQRVLKYPQTIWRGLLEAQRAGQIAPAHGLAFQRWQGVGPAGGMTGGVLRIVADLTNG